LTEFHVPVACDHGQINKEPLGLTPVPDWPEWHRAYDDPLSSLSRRLAVVRRLLRHCLDAAPHGEIPVLSLCAGDGRDLLGVLEQHPRRFDVRAQLIESDPQLVELGRRRVDELQLDAVEFVQTDAGDTATYGTSSDAQLVLACGIFGNVSDDDIRTTVKGLASLLAEGGSAIWTRHRLSPDLTPTIREWFDAAGFEETAFEPIAESTAYVGSNRLLTKATVPLPPRLFEFVGNGAGGLC
jgi:hypothetical protein